MKKKILSILLCSVIAATGAVTVNAAGKAEKHNGFEIIDETITVPDNVVMVSSYEFDDNNTYTAKILNENRDEFELLYKDCVESPQFIELPSGEKYQVAGYYSECSYDFSNTGGTYRKVKIKISEFSELSDYFNEDGTKTHQTPSGDELIFNHKNYSCEEYVMRSNLSCLSGGILTKVYPDENGEIEIYVKQQFCIAFHSFDNGFGTYLADKFFEVELNNTATPAFKNNTIIIEKEKENMFNFDFGTCENANIRMSGGKMDMSNPMMMYFLFKDGGKSDMLPLLFMAQNK